MSIIRTLQVKRKRSVRIDNRAGDSSLSMMTSRKIYEPSTMKSTNEDFPFSCEMCQTRFYDEKVYDAHMEGHKRLHCSFCGKPFKNPGRLADHEAQHKGLFKFKCSFCQKGFNHKNDYQRHEDTHIHSKKRSSTVIQQ